MYENSTQDKYAVVKLERFMKFQCNTLSVQCSQGEKNLITQRNNFKIVLEFDAPLCYRHQCYMLVSDLFLF